MKDRIKLMSFVIIGLAAFLMGMKMAKYVLDLQGDNRRLHEELIGQKEKYKQLSEHTAQLESKYIKQQQLTEAATTRFNEVIRERDERIKLLSDATYLIGRHVEKQDGPDYYFETPNRTKNYVLNELRLEGSESPAIGYVLIKSDGRTYKRNYKYEISVETLQTVDEDTGKIRVFSKAYLISREKSPLTKRVNGYKDWKDLKYPLKITGGTALIDPTIKNQLEPRFHWWAPHLNANINFLGNDTVPGIGVSLMGYGKTKNDLSYRFLQFGTQFNEQVGIQPTFIPVLWRPFSGLLTNTYIGPGVSVNGSEINYFLGLQIGL